MREGEGVVLLSMPGPSLAKGQSTVQIIIACLWGLLDLDCFYSSSEALPPQFLLHLSQVDVPCMHCSAVPPFVGFDLIFVLRDSLLQ